MSKPINNVRKSQFQYNTPKITKFVYNAFTNSPSAEYSMNTAYSVTIGRKGTPSADVVLNIVIRADGEDTPFVIDADIMSTFKWDIESEEPAEQLIQNILEKNAPSILVGYLRPIIAMFTNCSGFPPYNLPLIDFSKSEIHDTPQGIDSGVDKDTK